jgi:hypothetical protein
MTSFREAVLAKLSRARTTLAELRRTGEPAAAIEWQTGYVRALEEILDLEGLSLRRHPRRRTAIHTAITRPLLANGSSGQRGDGTIVDLSVGGCGLATLMELSAGEIIELSFVLPGTTTFVTLAGWVRRAQRIDREVRAGVEFKPLPERVVELLQAFCAAPTQSDEPDGYGKSQQAASK